MYIKKDIVIFTQKHLPHENKTTFVFLSKYIWTYYMIHVHSYFCYREEKTQFITYLIRHLFPCDPHCNEFFVKIKIPWFSRGHPRFDRHFVFLSPFQYRGPYFNLVKTLLSKKKNTRADMLERKDSGNNVQCVEKNNPEWPDTSQKTPGSFYPDQAKNSDVPHP